MLVFLFSHKIYVLEKCVSYNYIPKGIFQIYRFFGGEYAMQKVCACNAEEFKSLVSAIVGDKVSSSIKLPGSMAE